MTVVDTHQLIIKEEEIYQNAEGEVEKCIHFLDTEKKGSDNDMERRKSAMQTHSLKGQKPMMVRT